MNEEKAVGAYAVPLHEFLTINEHESIYTGIKMLKDALHSNGPWLGKRLLVTLDNNGLPTGILTIKCIFKAVGLSLLNEDITFKEEFFSWGYIDNMRKKGKVTVREIMRPLCMFSVPDNCSVITAARIFVRYRINHLPVTDGEKVTGILNLGELFYRYYESNGFRPLPGAQTYKAPLLTKLFGKFAPT